MYARLATATAASLVFALSAAQGLALPPDEKIDPGPEPTMAQKAEMAAAPEQWPMKIDEFLAKEYLTRSDIILTRRDYDLTSFVIRWATDSPYSHAALVFNRPRQETGISNTFVIEAGSSGVDLTNLRDYISDKSSFIAIKRFKKEWFSEEMQGRVRGVLLDKIKASYNYYAIGRIARTLWFGVQHAARRDNERTMEAYKQNEWTPPSEFICSGLVQIGFVETALEKIKAGELPPSALRDVVFLQRQRRWLPTEQGFKRLGNKARGTAAQFRTQNLAALESITPEDLARSDKLDWMYLIRHGMVYKVTSYDEAQGLINGGSAPSQEAIPTPEKPPTESVPPPPPPTADLSEVTPPAPEPASPPAADAPAAEASPAPANEPQAPSP